MDTKRFLLIQAVKTKDNDLIPIWDSRLKYKKTHYGTDYYELEKENIHYIVECIYDMKKKEIIEGIEINIYPEKTYFKVGDEVYYEVSHRNLKESKVKDIVYEEYDLEIEKGKKIKERYGNDLTEEKIDKDSIYSVKFWKPFYIMEDDKKIEWEHQIYKKV